jgi:hypothetical protein
MLESPLPRNQAYDSWQLPPQRGYHEPRSLGSHGGYDEHSGELRRKLGPRRTRAEREVCERWTSKLALVPSLSGLDQMNSGCATETPMGAPLRQPVGPRDRNEVGPGSAAQATAAAGQSRGYGFNGFQRPGRGRMATPARLRAH